MSATAGDGGVSFPCLSLSLPPPTPAVLSSLRSPLSPGIFCILPVLCNASPQFFCIPVASFCCWTAAWMCVGERRGRKGVCVCVCARVSACTHTCVSVLQSSVAMATSGTWLRQLCGPALPELGCRRPLSLSSGEMHTHTHTFLHVTQRQTDRLMDRLCLTQAQWILLSSLWQRSHYCVFLHSLSECRQEDWCLSALNKASVILNKWTKVEKEPLFPPWVQIYSPPPPPHIQIVLSFLSTALPIWNVLKHWFFF